MELKTGDKAPEFKLKDQDGKDVALEDFKGKKLIILFFPFANSSVCTTEMSLIKDKLKNFEDHNAAVVGISVDSHYSLKLWGEKYGFGFPLLSDFNKEVSEKYDSLYDIFAPGKYDYRGVSKRSAFVVNEDGRIKYIEICKSPGDQPDYDAISESLKD